MNAASPTVLPPGGSLLNLPGSKPAPKRRLSDASNDSTTAKKVKKITSDKPNAIAKEGMKPDPSSNGMPSSLKLPRAKAGDIPDFDKQCGVINDKGLPCSRSLTCKTHGMGAKRAVQGRSRPFDLLVADFQKYKEAVQKEKEARALENPKASPSKSSKSAGGGESGSKKTAGEGGASASAGGSATAPKKKKTDGKSGKSKAAARNKADLILGEVDDPPENDMAAEEEAPDSDDEVDQLLQAMRNSRAKPLADTSFPTFHRSSTKISRYRDTFLTAFTGRTLSAKTS